MPTYDYKCEACGLEKEFWLKMSEAGKPRACTECRGMFIQQPFKPGAIHGANSGERTGQ